MGLAIGDTTAEEIKIELGCALPLMTEKSMEVMKFPIQSQLRFGLNFVKHLAIQ